MRKVILYIAASLDGYIAKEDGTIDFLTTTVETPEEDASYRDLLKRIDTVVMGRTTYDQVVNELFPDYYPYEQLDSYIITHRLLAGSEHLFFTDQSPEQLIRQLKNQNGKDIWIVGGGQIIAPLVEHELIDEYIITTIPIILGKGIPLFQGNKRTGVLKSVAAYCQNGMFTAIYEK